MLTVIETPIFQKQAAKIWSESERMAFIDWIADNPLAGDVIPGADDVRKVRWAVAGKGKRGGARVIYFNLSAAVCCSWWPSMPSLNRTTSLVAT